MDLLRREEIINPTGRSILHCTYHQKTIDMNEIKETNEIMKEGNYVLVEVFGVIGDTENEYVVEYYTTEDSARAAQALLIQERDEAGHELPGYRVYPVYE